MLAMTKRQKNEPTELAAAQATAWAAAAEFEELTAKRDAMRCGLSLALDPASDAERCAPARALAGAFYELAKRRRRKVENELEDVEFELDRCRPQLAAATEAARIARRRETDRLAVALQPRQRAAVAEIGTALEALTMALEAERAIHEELRRSAPEQQSANLPDCSSELLLGSLVHWASPASAWARRMRKMGILQ